jgi:4-hydroxybenzoate polyprenyltransferase
LNSNKDYGLSLVAVVKAIPILIKSRAEALFLWVWSVILYCMIAGRGYPPLGSTLMVIASGVGVVLAVYIYNDLVDSDMDRLNLAKVNRSVLASGKISDSVAKLIIAIFSILGLSIAYLINLPTFLFTLCFYTLFMAYSNPVIRLKKRFLLKEMVTSGGQPIFALIASYAILGTVSAAALFGSIIFGIFGILTLPVISDTLDEKEDTIYGVKSLARALSWRRRVQLMGVAVLFMITVTPLTYTRFGINVLFPASVVVLSLFLLRWGIYPLRAQADALMIMRVRKFVFVYFFVSEIILIISTMSLNLPF